MHCVLTLPFLLSNSRHPLYSSAHPLYLFLFRYHFFLISKQKLHLHERHCFFFLHLCTAPACLTANYFLFHIRFHFYYSWCIAFWLYHFYYRTPAIRFILLLILFIYFSSGTTSCWSPSKSYIYMSDIVSFSYIFVQPRRVLQLTIFCFIFVFTSITADALRFDSTISIIELPPSALFFCSSSLSISLQVPLLSDLQAKVTSTWATLFLFPTSLYSPGVSYS